MVATVLNVEIRTVSSQEGQRPAEDAVIQPRKKPSFLVTYPNPNNTRFMIFYKVFAYYLPKFLKT